MHSNTRLSEVILVENLPRKEIKRLRQHKHNKLVVLDYDLCNDSTLSFADFIYKFIKEKFILNFFIAILTSFSFPNLPNILEISNKSCLQFIKIKKIKFNNFKQTVLSNPYNTIHFFISKEFIKYKLNLNKTKYRNYIQHQDTLLPCLQFNNTSYRYNKVFVENCVNLSADTFYCFYQILKMFINYAKPIFYTTLKTPRFVFSHKRAKQNSKQLPNVYQIPLIIFNNLLQFFPQTLNFNFNKVFSVTPLKKQKFSNDYAYYSIFEIDSCLFHMNIADRIFANSSIQYCSNTHSVFEHVFDKIYHQTEYITSDVVNSYSKRYILNEFIKGFNTNKNRSLTLNEYLVLKKCLMNIKSIHEIEFKIFLDKFEKIYLNIISTKYVKNLKKVVKPISRYDFIKSFNLDFKQEYKHSDYLDIKTIKTENINTCLYELKNVFREYTTPIQNTHSTLHTTHKRHHFKTRHDFIKFNRNKLEQLVIKGYKLECECQSYMSNVKKMCHESWMSYSNILNNYMSKTYLSREMKSNYIKINILQTAHTHLNCCLTNKQFDFIFRQTKVLDRTWIQCISFVDKKMKTITD